MDLLHSLLHDLPAIIYWVDNNNEYLGCNLRFAQLLGLALPEDIVKPATQELAYFKSYAAQIAAWKENNWRAIKLNQTLIVQEIFPLTSQSQVISQSYKLPIKNSHGMVEGLLNISFDQTQEQLANKKLQDEHSNLEIALNNIMANLPGHVYWQNLDGMILGCNDEQARALGYQSRKEVIGKYPHEVIPAAEANTVMQLLHEVTRAGQSLHLEEKMTFRHGVRDMWSQKVPLRNAQHDIMGILGLSVDISKQKEMERLLLQEKAKVEKAEQLKTDFIHNMEHDIRTPFYGVLGLSRILLEQETDPQKKEYIIDIVTSAQELLNYCDAILDFSKIEQGIVPILQQAFNLKKLLENVMQVETAAAKLKKLDLALYCDTALPEVLLGDPYRTKRILLNLLSNAVKFTRHGSIHVAAKVVKQNHKTGVVKISIRDTGIGISDEHKSFIYERFARGTPSNKGMYKGQGLGLRIVKQLIDELEGEISVESNVQIGTTFHVLLPFKLPLLDDNLI